MYCPTELTEGISVVFPVNIAQWGPYVFLLGQADLPISGLWALGSPDSKCPAQAQIDFTLA